MTPTIKLVADSFEEMKSLPDKCFDVTITDPPYSAHVQANLCSGSLVGTKAVPKYELPFAPMATYSWLRDALRITRRWVVVFCALEDFGNFKSAVGEKEYVRSCIWYKPNSMGQLTADRPATAYEGIALLHSTSPKKRWNGRGSFGIWKCNGTRGVKGRHPNQKPLALCSKLVALFTEPGEMVFDPFCGSGAIGAACVLQNRGYTGWDSSEEWAVKAASNTSIPYTGSGPDPLSLCMMKDPT